MISKTKKIMTDIIIEWDRFYSPHDNATIFKKILFFTKISIILPFAVLNYIGLQIINLFYTLRIGTLNSKGRISIMISYIEPYLRKIKLEKIKNPLIIVINPGSDPNEQLTKMYKRVIWLLDGKKPITRFLFAATHLFFFSHTKINACLKSGIESEFSDYWQYGAPLLSFTDKEEKLGKKFLRSLEIPESAEYICVGLREENYYKKIISFSAKNKFQSELISDTSIRNPSLNDYLPMMIDCAEQGFYVVYMGQFSEKRLPKNLHPKIIDYTPEIRTHFYDVYLLANCKFAIGGGGAGLWWFATAFNKPAIQTDSYELRIPGLRKGDLFIPAKRWVKKEKRFFTLKEMIEKGTYYSHNSNCEKDGVLFVRNTPEEINAVVQEMIQKLAGTWKTTKKDKILQKKFKNLFKPHNPAYRTHGEIGTKFLSQHTNLF